MEPLVICRRSRARGIGPWGLVPASLAFLTMACVGNVQGPGSPGSVTPGGTPGTGAGTGTGASGPGTPGTGATTGNGGTGSPSGGVNNVTTPPTNPGHVVMRRLNQTEYNNTVRDLFGTMLTPANDFPPDDLGGEFDNIGAALSLSPSYVEDYEAAAYALVDDLMASTDAARKQKIVSCDVATAGDACARTILSGFARKAWRRPVTTAEVDGLMTAMSAAKTLGAKPADGLRSGLTAVLISPYFIFKAEPENDPTSKTARRLNAHEIATRLSYTLWSTMPDDTLSAAADAGKLSTDDEIGAQIGRMFADPRIDSLLEGFGAAWLDTRSLAAHEADKTKFPTFTATIPTSMKTESRLFLSEFLHSDLSVDKMLNGRFTFVDAALASFYGLSRPAGKAATEFVRVDTSNAPRAGLLTLGSFLTTTSFATRTSVVKRGQYVFERLLCGEIAPPPPDVPSFPEPVAGLSGRQLAEQHRNSVECMGCHALMDPIGFGLENYDAVGAYRTMDGTAPVDSTGVLPNGMTFNGGVELADLLAKDPRFLRCLTGKFMTFATGRLMKQASDPTWIDYVATRVRAASTQDLSTVIRQTLMSDAFRSQLPALSL